MFIQEGAFKRRALQVAVCFGCLLPFSTLGQTAAAQGLFTEPGKTAPSRISDRCDAHQAAAAVAPLVTVTSGTATQVAHGGAIEIAWRLPTLKRTSAKLYLVGETPDTVRFEGNYQFDQDGTLANGPGFLVLSAKANGPYDIPLASDRTHVVIPIDDANVPRSGALRVKPYAAGSLTVTWSVVAVDVSCRSGSAGRTASQAVKTIGPFTVAPGTPEIVVQDFVTPDPMLELAQPSGNQRLTEVEISQDGRYRLEIFPRRYRVFDRSSGAKLLDRSGVKPRFSPTGRFLVASVGDADKLYPTNLEVIDLIAGKVVALAGGPIIAWSNADTLLLDAGRAYQSVTFITPLLDSVKSTDGKASNWLYFSPGCGTCDAWVSSNIRIDWNRLAVLRTDSGVKRAMAIAHLDTGRKFETSIFGDEEAAPLEKELRSVFGQPDVPVPLGWTSTASLKLTHVGRGYDGYADEDASLQPSEAGRPNQQQLIAPRRLALADGRVLIAQDLRPASATRGDERMSGSSRTRSLLNEGVDGELASFGLQLTEAVKVEEIPIPVQEQPGGNDPLVRTWPTDLKAEILAANPSLKEWFKDEEFPDIIVAAWRFSAGGIRYLLMQHGSPAMTANGAHDLSFDLLTLDGPKRGAHLKLGDISGLFSQFVGRDHTVGRVSVLSNTRLIVAVPGSGKGVSVALGDDSTPKPFDMLEPTLLCGFYEVAHRDLVVQGNCDGQLFLFDPTKQATSLLSGRVVDNELILYTAQGFYASTYEGAHFVHVSFPGLPGVHSFEQFAKVLERSDVVAGIISGHPVEVAAPDITPPPQLDVALRGGPHVVDISARAQSSTGLAFVDLYEDGRFVERQDIHGETAEIVFHRTPPAHVRTFSVVATDVKGFQSRPLPIAAPVQDRAQARNTLRVIAVGVDIYDTLEGLSGARFDAEKLVSELQSHASYYRTVKTTLRVDRQATPQIVMSDISAALKDTGADDTILFFFAGHGGRTDDGRYFMAVPGTDPDRLPETAIDWQQAAQLLGSTKGRVIAIIDACHSGQTAVAPVPNDGAVASLANATGAPMVVFAASKGRQLSEEAPDGAGGVFTQTLAKLLGKDRASTDGNGDGVLQMSEIYRNLRQVVDGATEARQTPWLVRRHIVGDAPLF